MELIVALMGGGFIAFTVSVFITPYCIRYLSRFSSFNLIRKHVPSRHLRKKGTPTGGGIGIIISYLTALLAWGSHYYDTARAGCIAILLFGAIGCLDDHCKMLNQGISSRLKYSLQSIAACIVLSVLHTDTESASVFPYHSLWWVIWGYWVIVGASNAFNLTDGLDGLAISQALFISLGLLVYTLLVSQDLFLGIILQYAVLIGCSMGFLLYNRYPAKIFMGDTGSLAIGGLLGTLAIQTNSVWAFGLMSCVPVLETLSVIIQVAYFRLTGKRVFHMAPFHHHLELIGVSEPAIVSRLNSVTLLVILCCLVFKQYGHLIRH